MTFENFWKPILAFAPDEGSGGGDGGDPGADGGAPDAGGDAGNSGGDPGADDTGPKWWQGEALTAQQREQLTNTGLTLDAPELAVAKLLDMEAAAQRKLGKPADQLMDKPGEGQDVAEWLRQNGDLFGVPETADKYDISRPEDWPKDAGWNEGLEGKLRELGHKHGVSNAAMNDLVGLYAGEVQSLLSDADQDLAAANLEMQNSLQKDWGDQYAAKVAQARQAASVLAEAAGLDMDAMANIASVLKPKVGDAATIKMFAAIGDLMGEDTAGGLGKGGAGLGDTPAQARAELAKQESPGGDWFEATKAKDRATMQRLQPRMEQLRKLASQ